MEPSYRAYRFDGFELDLKHHRLLGGEPGAELSSPAFRILECLCEHPRTLCTKRMLIQKVWETRGLHVEEASVKTFISEIRKALGKKGNIIIRTWRKDEFADGDKKYGGYSLDCEVERIEADSGPEKRTTVEGLTGTVKRSTDLPGSHDIPDMLRTEHSIAPITQIAEEVSKKNLRSPSGSFTEPLRPDDDVTSKQEQGSLSDTSPSRDDFHAVESRGDKTFARWLSGFGNWIVALLLLSIIVTVALSISFSTGDASKDVKELHKKASQVASGAQCVVIIILFLHSLLFNNAKGFRPDKQCNEEDIVKAGFKNRKEFKGERDGLELDQKKFTWYWRLLLLSWVPLYLTYTFGEHRYFIDTFGNHFHWKVGLNLVNTVMIAVCFNSLNKYVDEQDREHARVAFLNIVVLLLVGGGGAALLLWKENTDLAIVLTGIMAGITMALFIGRLQSRFIGQRFFILYLLYSYTAIQPLALYIEVQPDWGWKILDFALFLKCLLYVLMLWLFRSGLLLFYFASVKRLSDKALDEQRAAFRKLLTSSRRK